jgi:class 3 adenylate cyclase/tetratricopeptide (TPR) repeat protein
MSCSHCGTENPEGSGFCRECGSRLEGRCPGCGAQVEPGVRFCPACGEALDPAGPAGPPSPEDPRAPRPGPEAERKLVTVLFCDIVGSTALTERLGAEAMHALLNRFYDLALEEVHRYGGRVSKFLGDGFMAIVGAPTAQESHARRAVLAALGLRGRLADDSIALDGSSVSVQTRMGIDTGVVVVGSVGDDVDAELAAIGDAVNVAERLQGLARPGAILVSDATARLVAGYVWLEPVGEVHATGRSVPVVAHRVVGVGPRRSPLEGLGSPSLSRFVGRERQMAALAEAAAQAREGRGQIVGVVGEPGLGKTRLIYEFRRSLGNERITLLEGRCLAYGSAIPYLPVKDHVRANCGILDSDAPLAVVEKVRFGLEEVGLDPDDRAPFLLHLLGATEGTEALAELTPEAVKVRTFETVLEWTLTASRRRPIVLVYEDLHWVDAITEELLTSVAGALHGAAILMICTFRPGYRAPWVEHSYATQLSLPPLTPGESADVVRGMLGDSPVPRPLSEMVIDKAEGNPFFAEELARAIRDRHDPGAGADVPDTIQDVLMARIDGLPDEARRLLQLASVIGREFSPRLLEPLWGEPFLLDPNLAELKRREFIYERTGAEEPVYVFAHALTHEVAYDSLLVSTRRALHEAVGRTLERLYADRVDEVLDRLAHHYSRTERSGKAVEYLSRFAERAVQGYAHAEAARALEEALPHAERFPAEGRDRRVVELVMRLVSSLYFQGRFEESLDLLLRHQERVETLGDPQIAGEYYFWLGHTYAHIGDPTGAGRFAARAIEEAGRAGDDMTIGKARYVMSREGFWLGRYAEGAEHGRAAVAALEATGEWWWLGHALCWEAINLCCLGDFEAAFRAVERPRAIGRERHDPRLQSYSAWMRGRLRAVRGDWEAAIADLNESLETSPDPLNSAYATGWLGFSHREKGDHARAIAVLEQSVASLTEFRYRRLACVFAGFLAGAYRLAGRIEEAREAAEGALALSEELRYPWSIALARRELGRIHLAAGDLASAERRLGESLELLTGLEMSFEVAVAHLDLAELARRREQPEVAAQHLEVCRGRFAALGAPAYLERADRLARRLEGSLADDDSAGERLPDVGPPPPEAGPGEAGPERVAPAPQWHLLDDT